MANRNQIPGAVHTCTRRAALHFVLLYTSRKQIMQLVAPVLHYKEAVCLHYSSRAQPRYGDLLHNVRHHHKSGSADWL